YGVLLFAIFYVAPVAFRKASERRMLLALLVGMGAYLGLTTLFETVHLNALVFPRYILNPNIGTHFGRGRGPFVEAVTNGTALFVVPNSVVQSRSNDSGTVFDRYNMDTAAVRMIEKKPLFGFGWNTFAVSSTHCDCFILAQNYPMTAQGFNLHNEFLSHGAEL